MNGYIEEQIRFETADGPKLAGRLAYPESGEPARAVLLCPPHPNFAGTMDNNVISAVAEDLAIDSLVLRFDYRGVGDSQILLPDTVNVFDYWQRIEEEQDYAAPLADALAALAYLAAQAGPMPLFAVGYSFGSWMAGCLACRDRRIVGGVGLSPPLTRIDFTEALASPAPILLVTTPADFVYCPDQAAKLARAEGAVTLLEVEAEDHFYRGQEQRLTKPTRDWIAGGQDCIPELS